jgi:hypothetical protein
MEVEDVMSMMQWMAHVLATSVIATTWMKNDRHLAETEALMIAPYVAHSSYGTRAELDSFSRSSFPFRQCRCC